LQQQQQQQQQQRQTATAAAAAAVDPANLTQQSLSPASLPMASCFLSQIVIERQF
jgi:hypothetical protein